MADGIIAAAPKLVLDDTMGAGFIGVVVAGCLYGVSCVQAWYYFTHQTDQWPLKLLVAAVIICDTVHQMLITHTLYSYVISNYNNPTFLGSCVWSLLVEVLFNGFTAMLVQSFLTLRVWRLSGKNIWVTSVVMSLVLAEFGCVMAFAGIALTSVKTFADLAMLKDLSVAVNALAAVGDVLIAATLCTLLHRSRTGFAKSDTMINKLIIFAVNTGLLTSLCAVGSLISILVAPNTFWYITFFFTIGRLYTNSLLATLNARKKIRNAADGINSTSDKFSLSLGPIRKTHNDEDSSPRRRGRICQGNISIKIDTTHDFSADLDREKDGVLPIDDSSPSQLSPTRTIPPVPPVPLSPRSKRASSQHTTLSERHRRAAASRRAGRRDTLDLEFRVDGEEYQDEDDDSRELRSMNEDGVKGRCAASFEIDIDIEPESPITTPNSSKVNCDMV